MKPDSGLVYWSPRIIEAAKKYTLYVKVSNVVEDLDVIYPEFKKLNKTYKKSLVGKCLISNGLIRHSRCNQGYVYRRPEPDVLEQVTG
jgi:hypothetical protein